ncbi:ATP-dependent protease ClpP, protease subunit [Monaibacterium marinum]|uniref:ATP-dependent protease ClpP, protease subunit n=1 Tax=Pontivivens marinum TaxID=1690039 RepID=A0A2C9CQ63_9RHOB|nr:head maturation protease, ClpP-related [Monaibacterium marinum]SOH93368.1 ATP-dependent protease ClpP, protease subunit [Monaibacterium marinum]
MESDLVVGGEIVLSGVIGFDWWTGGGITHELVVAALEQFPGDVTVRLNSGGGHATEGAAIHAALVSHPGRVTVIVEGLAASAASLLAMAADDLVMSEAAMLMIHDPSTGIYGTAGDMRDGAAALDALAGNYARIYGKRAGITARAARDIMIAERWYGSQEAVDAGFADRVAGAEGADADSAATASAMNASVPLFDYRLYANAPAELVRMAETRLGSTSLRERPDFVAASAAAQQQPSAATSNLQENNMPDRNPQSTPDATPPVAPTMTAPTPAPAPVPAPTPAPDMAAVRAQAVQGERDRSAAIRAAAAPFMSTLGAEAVASMIDEGITPEQANARILTLMAGSATSGGAPTPSGQRAHIQRDAGDTRMSGMVGALMHRAAPNRHAMEGPAVEFRHMGLRGLAMSLGGGTGYNQAEMVRQGMRSTTMMGGAHGVSDFAYITTEVMRRMLRADYTRRAPTWGAISRRRTATDFRSLHSVRFGGDLTFKTVGENGEYQQAQLSDEAESLAVQKYGRTLNITFEAIVNDDMGAFERLPSDFARNARNLESKIIWGLIRDNAKLGDNKALFHAGHGNLAGSAGAVSVAAVGAGRKAMWEQRPYGSTDKSDFIEVEPDLLFVPPALELAALQFTTAVNPNKQVDVNPFTLTPTTEARLGSAAGGSDTAWYLFSSELPPLEHALLEGFEEPMVETKSGMNPDGVTMDARHIFGANATEYRGSYKNAGA